MARTQRTNDKREADHNLTSSKFETNALKVSELNLQGKPHFCALRDQRIDPKVCEKVQSTAGCKIGPLNKTAETGCPCFQTALNAKASSTPRKKSSGPSKPSYQTIMTQVFLVDGTATLKYLVDTINNHPERQSVERKADDKNVSVGISILKNSNRVKNPLRIEYSRITKLYYFLDHKEAANQYKKDMAKIEDDKKTKRAAAAKAKKAEEAKGETKPSEPKKAGAPDLTKITPAEKKMAKRAVKRNQAKKPVKGKTSKKK